MAPFLGARQSITTQRNVPLGCFELHNATHGTSRQRLSSQLGASFLSVSQRSVPLGVASTEQRNGLCIWAWRRISARRSATLLNVSPRKAGQRYAPFRYSTSLRACPGFATCRSATPGNSSLVSALLGCFTQRNVCSLPCGAVSLVAAPHGIAASRFAGLRRSSLHGAAQHPSTPHNTTQRFVCFPSASSRFTAWRTASPLVTSRPTATSCLFPSAALRAVPLRRATLRESPPRPATRLRAGQGFAQQGFTGHRNATSCLFPWLSPLASRGAATHVIAGRGFAGRRSARFRLAASGRASHSSASRRASTQRNVLSLAAMLLAPASYGVPAAPSH